MSVQKFENIHLTLGTTEPCTLGPRRKEQWPHSRLAYGSPEVSAEGVGWWWHAAGLGAQSVALHAWDLLREVTIIFIQFSSVQFIRSVVSDSMRPHELQQARPPCPSPTTGVYPNSCPLSRWCHLTFSSSVVPFSSCLQSFATSGSFQMIQLFTSGGQNIGVSASTSILPMNTQDWFPLGWTGWISLQSKGLSRVFSNTTVQSINSLVLSFLYRPTLTSIHDYWKNHSLD